MNAKYRAKEIVWAKIEPYPWWPGKIINIHIQSNEIIYKILFFADPTFAYLQESQICTYPNNHPNNHAHYSIDSRLNKAIKLADEAQNKIEQLQQRKQFKMSLQYKKTQTEVAKQSSLEVPTKTEQNRSSIYKQLKEALPDITTIQDRPRVQLPPHNMLQQQNSNNNVFVNYGQITKDNILQVLSKRMDSSQKFQYNYENRKKVIQKKMQLKRMLLQRYNLHHQYMAQEKIQPSKKIIESSENRPKSNEVKRLRIHKKKVLNKNITYFKNKCIRRLYQISRQLQKTQDKVINYKQVCSDIVKKIFLICQQSQSKYQDIFLNLIKTMCQNGRTQVKNLERTLADMNVWLQKMESEKHEDEQGSKMTQIPSISH